MKRIIIGNRLSKARVKVGQGLETKINLIIGANNNDQVELEKKKIEEAAKFSVHTIIDLSIARIDPPLWAYGREHYPEIASKRKYGDSD